MQTKVVNEAYKNFGYSKVNVSTFHKEDEKVKNWF